MAPRLHLATRRVLPATRTAEPNQAWVSQQGPEPSLEAGGMGIEFSAMIYGRDKKRTRRTSRLLHQVSRQLATRASILLSARDRDVCDGSPATGPVLQDLQS